MPLAGRKPSSGVSSEADMAACNCSAGNCDIKNLSRGSKVAATAATIRPAQRPRCTASSPAASPCVSCLSKCRQERSRCEAYVLWLQVYLPVFVEGGKLSVGDMHFSQGDGEVSFCGAL